MFISDIDGTLSDATHRLHYIDGYAAGEKQKSKDWPAFLAEAVNDPPIWPMVYTLRALARSWEIVLSTGRRENQRDMTVAWLHKYGIPFDNLLMRPLDDNRSDYIVKPEVLAAEYGPHPFRQVQTIFEDRKRVAEAWRALGYHVCQVAEGDY